MAREFLTPLDMGGSKITGAATGVSATDVAVVGQVIQVIQPSGDETGATDAASINTAVAALPAAGGCAYLAPGAWYIACGVVVISRSGVYIDGAGRWATAVSAVGEGDCIRMYDASDYDTRTVHSGGVRGMSIDGSACTGTSAGIHAGDIFALDWDVAVTGFTAGSSTGILWDNQWTLAEQMTGRAWVAGCKTNYMWTQTPAEGSTECTGSFERGQLALNLDQDDATFDGFTAAGGVYFSGSVWVIGGNANGTNSGAVTSGMFRATGATPAGSADGDAGSNPSSFSNFTIFSNIECPPGFDFTPTTFITEDDCYVAALSGVLDFSAAGDNFTPTPALVGFQGYTAGDPNITSQTVNAQLFQGTTGFGTYAGPGTVTSGSTIATGAVFAEVTTAANVTGVILAAGTIDGQLLIVSNTGTHTVTFAAKATSNVTTGTACVIPAGQLAIFAWSITDGTWSPQATSASGAFTGGTLTSALAPEAASLTFGTSIAVNAASGNAFNLTLTASTGTIANPTNPVDGQVIRFRITQGTGGSRTVAWGTAYDFGAGSAPTLSTTAAKVDIIAFEYVSSISKWCYLGAGTGF